MECRSAVLQLLLHLLAQKGDLDPLANDSPIFTNGRLQSIDAIQVAVFLEQHYDVDFAATGFDQDKIDTVDSICALIEESQVEGNSPPTPPRSPNEVTSSPD